MATYTQIQAYVKDKYGYLPKSCWIAHVKELSGLHPKVSPNRYSISARTNPCPDAKQADLKDALRHFNML